MKIINIKQNTDEWKARRAVRIGASDASTVMGIKSLQDSEELQKRILTGVGKDLSHIEAIKFGNKMEPVILAGVLAKTGIKFESCVVDHETIPNLSASLDGYDGGVRGLEIKSYFYKRKEWETKEQFRENGVAHGIKRWNSSRAKGDKYGYYWQIMAQFASADILESILLAGYPVVSPEGSIEYQLYKREDHLEDIALFEKTAQEWWQKHIVDQKTFVEVVADDDSDLAALCQAVVQFGADKKDAEAKEKAARAELLKEMDARHLPSLSFPPNRITIGTRENPRWDGIVNARTLEPTEQDITDFTKFDHKAFAASRGIAVGDLTDEERAAHCPPATRFLQCTVSKPRS